jgi:hypothetical protein
LPLRNENGKELPVSIGISGGFNEALAFFRKKKKIEGPTIQVRQRIGAESREQRAESRVKRLKTQFEWLEIRCLGIFASRH